MKKLIILMFALFAINGAMAQWFPQNSGTTKRLKDVFFTNVDTGYVVGNNDTGDGGIILKTTNGGIDWITLMIADTLEFNSVYFTDANTGYVAGGKQYWTNPVIILKTTNGGTTWSIVFNYSNSNGSASLISVYFPDPNTGYAVGNIMYTSMGTSPFIIKTNDGGANWTLNDTVVGEKLSSIYFTSVDTGYLVGEGDDLDWIILKTTNGGIDWTSTNSGVQWNYAGLSSVFFPDANTGYAVGRNGWESGLILKTTNGGTDWIEQSSGISQLLRSVYFNNADTGYVVGGVSIYNTTDGGTNWIEQSSGISQGLNSVYFINAGTGYVVGGNGTILKTTNGGLTGLNEISYFSEFLNIYPNPSNNKITFSSPSLTGNTQLSIFNVNGSKVIEMQLNDNETQIDISALPRGVYFVRLQNEKMVVVGKMIKQ
ncbi:MAG: T9SS type A sorting domain-containing protein [Bacteroidetes bacterium]|nr:T9SS type A sorting domain-containing protein [Bacteroidota bacterium]MBL6943218.1 T9SS type A sorting domain-containing protein [Bacteroidales bacterium]